MQVDIQYFTHVGQSGYNCGQVTVCATDAPKEIINFDHKEWKAFREGIGKHISFMPTQRDLQAFVRFLKEQGWRLYEEFAATDMTDYRNRDRWKAKVIAYFY